MVPRARTILPVPLASTPELSRGHRFVTGRVCPPAHIHHGPSTPHYVTGLAHINRTINPSFLSTANSIINQFNNPTPPIHSIPRRRLHSHAHILLPICSNSADPPLIHHHALPHELPHHLTPDAPSPRLRTCIQSVIRRLGVQVYY